MSVSNVKFTHVYIYIYLPRGKKVNINVKIIMIVQYKNFTSMFDT